MTTAAPALASSQLRPISRTTLPRSSSTVRIGLFGFGHVGSAVVRLARDQPRARHTAVEVTAALVRDLSRPRPTGGIPLATDAERVFATRPSVIVEALGGVEPARTLVLEALARGIPVVTANKSLLAHHGDELLAAAACANVPLRYEASVIAGVPFLGTFAERPYAAAVSSLTGIVNGTTNFILSRMLESRTAYDAALLEAQTHGYAEPDPGKDVGGVDAAEKLAILIRGFAGRRVDPGALDTHGITDVTPDDLLHASALEGIIKPIAHARGLRHDGAIAAFIGPAFVGHRHALAAINGPSNGLCLEDVRGNHLCFTGPGAGPDVTAVTILDDVLEAVERPLAPCPQPLETAKVVSPVTRWFLRIASPHGPLPTRASIAGLLGRHDVIVERPTARTSRAGRESQAFLTTLCEVDRIDLVRRTLSAAGLIACGYRVID